MGRASAKALTWECAGHVWGPEGLQRRVELRWQEVSTKFEESPFHQNNAAHKTLRSILAPFPAAGSWTGLTTCHSEHIPTPNQVLSFGRKRPLPESKFSPTWEWNWQTFLHYPLRWRPVRNYVHSPFFATHKFRHWHDYRIVFQKFNYITAESHLQIPDSKRELHRFRGTLRATETSLQWLSH